MFYLRLKYLVKEMHIPGLSDMICLLLSVLNSGLHPGYPAVVNLT
jgi:hypothetical protein